MNFFERKKVFGYLLSISIIFLFLNFFLESRSIFSLIHQIEFSEILIQSIFSLLLGVINGYMSYIIYCSLQLELSSKEWIGLGFINTLANYIFPMRTGTIIKASFLKKKFNFNYIDSVTTLLFASLFNLFYFILFSSTILIFYQQFKHFAFVMLAISIGSLVFLSFIKKSRFFYLTDKLPAKISYLLQNLFIGLKVCKRNKPLLIKLFIANTLLTILLIMRLSASYSALNISTNIEDLIFINFFSSISGVFQILPGNLGIQEVLTSVTGKFVGQTGESGLAAAGIIRLGELLTIIILGSYFFKVLRIGGILQQNNNI